MDIPKKISEMRKCRLLLICLFACLNISDGANQSSLFDRPDSMSSAAINKAIEQCRPGDTIRLPAGTYDLRESVRMKSGVQLIGAGQDKTILVYSGERPDPFILINNCEDVTISELTLDGRNRPLGQDGIRVGNSRRLNLHHLTIRDLAKGKSNFVHAIIFSGHNPTMERGVTDSIIYDCLIERIGLGAEFGGGIRMAWGSVRNRVERNIIRDTGRGGIFGDHSPELIIRNNTVSGSGGEGLGIEIWGGCPRSLIEDNAIGHWLSVDSSDRTAVRRNVIGARDGSHKYIGIEIIARDCVVTDNTIERGNSIGLSVSNKPVKNNVFWGYNTVKECSQWGAQFQGETGGIARHYLYRCTFEKTIRGDAKAVYPGDSGHGFRFNGDSREIVFEDCIFRDNGGLGVQSCGQKVDAMSFLRCVFKENAHGSQVGFSADRTIEFKDCSFEDKAAAFPPTEGFSNAPPKADFRLPSTVRAGVAARFECVSTAEKGDIVERLWDFNHGVPEVSADPTHTFEKPGKYRVTLVVWDGAGRGARAEKTVEVISDPVSENRSAFESLANSGPSVRSGRVRVVDHSLVDDHGPFLGLGVSYFTALWRYHNDRPRLESDLAFLSQQGFNYTRILSMVGWFAAWDGLEIAPIAFTSREGKTVKAWPDYWQSLAGLIDLSYDRFGLRTQITIFADAQLMPRKADRIDHMRRMLKDVVAGREHKIILLEVANEGWQNGFPGDQGMADLREFARYLAERTEVPIAITSNHEGSFETLYRDSAADIATWHFSRDRSADNGWRPVIDCRRLAQVPGCPPVSSNEPIGPGSSVASESDPVKLVLAAAYAYASQLPMYVFHSQAGVFGKTRFENTPAIRYHGYLAKILPPDLPNGKSFEGRHSDSPVGAEGCLTMACNISDNRIVCVPVGILPEGLTLTTRVPMYLRAIDLLTGNEFRSIRLNAGERTPLKSPSAALILIGDAEIPKKNGTGNGKDDQ